MVAALVALPVTTGAPALAAPPKDLVPVGQPAPTKAEGWSYRTSVIPAGVNGGAELAVDSGRGEVVVTDADFLVKDRSQTEVVPDPHILTPKLSVLNAKTKKVAHTIDFTTLPLDEMKFKGARFPMLQIPFGLALDTELGRAVTTNTHPNGVTIVDLDKRAASASDMATTGKLDHPMGVTVDSRTHRAYVASTNDDSVSVIDTRSRREVARIRGIYLPTMVDVDPARNRLYVGNADTKNYKNNFVAVVDTTTNRVIKKIAAPYNSRPTVDTSTGLVYAGSYNTGLISVIDPDSLTVIDTIETGTTPVKVAIDAARGLAYTPDLHRKSITVIDLRARKAVLTVPTGIAIHSVAVDQKSGTVFATQNQTPKLTVLNVTRS